MIIRTNKKWVNKEVGSITLNTTYPNGWIDFVSASQIEESNETYKNVFDVLNALYGDLYCIESTSDYLSNKLRFFIEQEVEKYNKQNEIWDNQIDRLFGEYNELNQFRTGDLLEDPENYDQFKTARQTELKQKDVLKQIKEIQNMKTPLENVVSNIHKKIFIPIKGGKNYGMKY